MTEKDKKQVIDVDFEIREEFQYVELTITKRERIKTYIKNKLEHT